MKRIILLVMLTTGCANLQFNHEEYTKLITIQFKAQRLKESCESLSQKKIDDLKDDIRFQKLFAEGLVDRSDLTEASQKLDAMIQPLTLASSPAYCKAKLDNVNEAIKIIETIEALRY